MTLKGQIGYIGLGKMGLNMAARLVKKGWGVVAIDPDVGARSGAEKAGIKTVESAVEVVNTLRRAQGSSHKKILVWVMVPHTVVDSVLQEITPELEAGDTVIDGGNSYYKDTVRRGKGLAEKGVEYLDVGVSGGPAGARAGACLMVGGRREVYQKHEELFRNLAVEDGYAYVGGSGVGHFVKMVHNGIEYGMMQAIAEGFAVMQAKDEFSLDLSVIADLYNHGSVVQSRLTEWLAQAYQEHGQDLGDVSGTAAHSGEGAWTVEAAKELGVPAPVIEGALQFRIDSEKNPSYTGQVVSALRNQFGGHEVGTQNSKRKSQN